jgi:hypothetical protein
MVINDFHILCTCIRPMKIDSPLLIDANAVLTRTIAFECFKVIAGWNPQVIKPISDFELPQFAPCDFSNIHELPDTIAS